MNHIFEIIDKTERKIRLTNKQWSHILKRHYDMINYQEEIKDTLKNPQKITNHPYNKNSRYYYNYLKHKQNPDRYLLVIVKYLNGEGFIVTTYFRRNVKWK